MGRDYATGGGRVFMEERVQVSITERPGRYAGHTGTVRRVEAHWCNGCENYFSVNLPSAIYSGPAILVCPRCDRNQPRTFDLGVAINCDLGWGKVLTLKGRK